MSKATNGTQRVTFGKTTTLKEAWKVGGRNSLTPVLLGGVQVGIIFKDGIGGYANHYDVRGPDGVALATFRCDWADGHGEAHDSRWDWQTARNAAKAFAVERFTPTEEPTEEPAQAHA